jgi:hypothetical protein
MAAELTAAHDAPASQFQRPVAGVIERAEQDRVGPLRTGNSRRLAQEGAWFG